jgi:hypothetical protein
MSSPIPNQSTGTAMTPPDREQHLRHRAALLWHSLGFAMLVLLLWADELFSFLYRYFGGDWRQVDLFDAAIRSGIVMLLWMISAYKVWQTLSRMSQLESLLHVCAWCNRVKSHEKWQTLEALLTTETGRPPSHGICPACAEKFTTEGQGGSDQATITRE